MSVGKHRGNTFPCVGIGKDIVKKTPTAQEIISRIDRWDYMDLKALQSNRNTRVKRQITE